MTLINWFLSLFGPSQSVPDRKPTQYNVFRNDPF